LNEKRKKEVKAMKVSEQDRKIKFSSGDTYSNDFTVEEMLAIYMALIDFKEQGKEMLKDMDLSEQKESKILLGQIDGALTKVQKIFNAAGIEVNEKLIRS
jgi:hypothetical protein